MGTLVKLIPDLIEGSFIDCVLNFFFQATYDSFFNYFTLVYKEPKQNIKLKEILLFVCLMMSKICNAIMQNVVFGFVFKQN
jgi:hypothetical protein